MSETPNVRLLGDRVLVRHDDSLEKEHSTEGGIIVPGGSYVDEADVMTWGEVVAVGPGRVNEKGHFIPTEVRVGDRVMYNRFLKRTKSGEALADILGDEFALVNEGKDIVAVEEKD